MNFDHYNRLRNKWVQKYGTFRMFDRWYQLRQAIEALQRETA